MGASLEPVLAKSPHRDDLPGGISHPEKDLALMPPALQKAMSPPYHYSSQVETFLYPPLPSSLLCPWPWAVEGGAQTSPLGGEKGQAHHIPSHCSLTQVQAGAEVRKFINCG